MDVGEVLADFSCSIEKETVTHFHDGGFVYRPNFTLAYVFRILEGELQYSFRGLLSYELYRLDNAINDDMLNAAVFSFGVLPDKDSVNIVVWGFITSNGFAGSDIGEKIEGSAQGKVERDMAFANWCL